MTKPSLNALAFATLVFCALPVQMIAKSDGVDAGQAGVPGETSCAQCHTGTGSGKVEVTFPNGLTYTPGVKQTLTVTVTDSVQKRWGFQMTARAANNTKTQAGFFTPGVDSNTQLVCINNSLSNESFAGCNENSFYPLLYIEHTATGTQAGKTGSATFSFSWTPPTSDLGNVTIYVSAVAANNDLLVGGDITYSKTYNLAYVAPVLKPAITTGGIVNGASYLPGIAAGSWFSIQGTNLTYLTTRTWRTDDFVKGALPTSLDGVSVTVNGKPAYVQYISDTQINAQSPSDAGVGSASVIVTVNGVSSAPATTQILNTWPAFFLWAGKYAVATRADYSYIGPTDLFAGSTTPAKAGDTVILWGTGFGSTTPAVPAGVQVSGSAFLTNAPRVTVGGFNAQVIGAALAPGTAGLYQIAITLPAALPAGDHEVIATADGVPSPSGVFITVK